MFFTSLLGARHVLMAFSGVNVCAYSFAVRLHGGGLHKCAVNNTLFYTKFLLGRLESSSEGGFVVFTKNFEVQYE